MATKVMHGQDVPAWIRGPAIQAMDLARSGIESLAWPRRPQAVNFEITAQCDARCIHCPRHEMDRSQRPMDFELFTRLIDQAAELGVPSLYPNGFGEILTMRDQLVDKYLGYIRSKKHRFEIGLNSNGFRLTESKIRLFFKHEVDFINITLDGATAETFEKIRVNLKLDQCEANVHRLMELRRELGLAYPRVRIGLIRISENEHERPAFMEKWNGKVDFVGIGGFTNRAGSLDASFEVGEHIPVTGACVLPFRDLNIWADGKAVLCCDDWNESYVVGNLNEESLEQIWHGPALKKARELHMAGRGADLDICRSCNMWRAPMRTARLWA
ncbi:SPASM domain-containing protein [Pendulispora brunnea]|uniref:SPASM domain-containing protein n=1 Tax=Pendulispora brunnea TaxID=2905690 RepID=A0ABZ2KH18_9BACT